MSVLSMLLDELVTANRILAREGVVDSFGHVSMRHPDRPDRYILSRARAPQCIEVDDLMEFALDGTAIDPAGRKPYAERFIHGAVYEARTAVRAVVHHHSASVIPFSVTCACQKLDLADLGRATTTIRGLSYAAPVAALHQTTCSRDGRHRGTDAEGGRV